VSYVAGATTGSLSFTPVANAFGTALIRVRAQDDGASINGGMEYSVSHRI
jgi:hypothetical protein